jgi:hypothetical protein
MRRIDSVVGEQWTIVDERGGVVFVGTKQGCEDWLDYQDNAQRRPSAVTAWIRWLFAAWLTPPVRVSSILRLSASRGATSHLPIVGRHCTHPRRVLHGRQ